MNLSMKQKQTHRHREQTCGYRGGGNWGRDGLGVWVSRCKLLHIDWINNKVLLYSTGNYIQYPVTEKNIKKNVYKCITESLCYIAEINTTL